MYIISKEFHFSASHQLLNLPKQHPCSRLHGHNYKVRIVLAAESLDKHGFVIDFNDLDIVKHWIDANLDHKHLNDVFDFSPTAENIARRIFDVVTMLLAPYVLCTAVDVSETDKTWARYAP